LLGCSLSPAMELEETQWALENNISLADVAAAN